jgi:4-oxalocrotonate tautomerase
MPHVAVKMFPGPSEQKKKELAAKILKAVTETFGYGEETVSIAMDEVTSRDWTRKVYDPEIQPNMNRLYKKPGYERF